MPLITENRPSHRPCRRRWEALRTSPQAHSAFRSNTAASHLTFPEQVSFSSCCNLMRTWHRKQPHPRNRDKLLCKCCSAKPSMTNVAAVPGLSFVQLFNVFLDALLRDTCGMCVCWKEPLLIGPLASLFRNTTSPGLSPLPESQGCLNRGTDTATAWLYWACPVHRRDQEDRHVPLQPSTFYANT